MKKILSMILAVVLIFAVLPLGAITASAATSGTTGDCTWTIDGTVLTISGNGRMGDYFYSTVPGGTFITEVKIENGVTSIGDCAFYNFDSLVSIDIPDTVTSIGNRAFLECSIIKNITLPGMVTSIGYEAFCYCRSLTSITMPDSVVNVEDRAFYSCDNLRKVYINDLDAWCNINFEYYFSHPLSYTGDLYLNNKLVTDITIPNGVSAISNYAFMGCSSLTSVIVPDSVTSIGDWAFSNCDSLTSVTIGNGVTSIGEYAFYKCISLTDIWYLGSNADRNNITFGTNNEYLTLANWYYNTCKSDKHSYLSECDETCENCEWIRTAPASHNFTNDCDPDCDLCDFEREIIHNFEIQEFDTLNHWSKCKCGEYSDIENHTFVNGSDICSENCGYRALTYVINNNEVEIIDLNSDFEGELVVPKYIEGLPVTKIGDAAFFECYGLTSVTIPDSVTVIGHSAFGLCRNLTNIILPDTINSIDSFAFEDSGYYLDDANWEDDVLYIGKYCIAAKTTISSDCVIKPGTKLIVPMSFRLCENLKSVTIPDSVVSIGEYAFWGCRSLENIVIPDGITAIEQYTFWDCRALKSVTIPASVKSIGDAAFKTCKSLSNIYYLGESKSNIDFGEDCGLGNATWYNNACIGTTVHTYDNIADATCNVCGKVRDVQTNGWQLDNNVWYYCENGSVVIGWQNIGGTWYYFNQNGAMQTGWVLDGFWYYLADNGAMMTGWQNLGGTWYYFNQSGAMQTGWLLDGVWYYLADNGAMVDGWQYIGNTWYYFNGGAMQTGWLNQGGTWYYLADGGNMVTGWQYIGSSWYYFNDGGNMATGWLLLGGAWYYLADGGNMLTDWQFIDGTWYYFNSSGAWVG